ncbi:MAG: Arm DNA-binding domain-containing protein [Mariprofundales bacterium]
MARLRSEAHNDGGGLDLVVSPHNKKTWRLRYAFRDKRYEMALGHYSEVSLKGARNKTDVVRGSVTNNINPKHAQADNEKRQQMTFEIVVMEWWGANASSWQYKHARKIKNWIMRRAVPVIGQLPMDGIDAGHITEIMISMSNTECSPFLAILNRIFGRAMALRLTKHNPAQGFPLRDVIPPLPKTKHRAAITDPTQLGQLLRDLRDNESGTYFTNQAARLLPYIFVRPKEPIHLK